jgi:hypothetical protein
MTTLEQIEILVHDGFREIKERFQEVAKSSQETERRFQETERHFQETERRFQETERRFQETERRFQETDQRFQATDRIVKKTSEAVEKLSTEVRGLTKSLGLFAEAIVHPRVVRLFRERGIVLDRVTARDERHVNGDSMEIDVLGSGPDAVLFVEVKFKLEVEDVRDTMKNLERFFYFYPEYRGLTLYGAVAGMSIVGGADRFAYKKGLFVLTQAGDNMRILNDEKFVPQTFPVSPGQKPKRRKRSSK